MIPINLKDLLYIIPDMINLFLSGYIFMTIFIWLNNKSINFSAVTLWSLFTSFIIKNTFSLIHQFILCDFSFSSYFKIMVYIITGATTPFLIQKLTRLRILRNLIYNTNYKSIHDDIFNDIIDYDEPTMMQVYLKTSDIYYIGKFCFREEKGLDSWLVLINYITVDKKNDELLFDPQKSNTKTTVAINLHDIERIELIYEDNSKVWKYLSGEE